MTTLRGARVLVTGGAGLIGSTAGAAAAATIGAARLETVA